MNKKRSEDGVGVGMEGKVGRRKGVRMEWGGETGERVRD